MSRLAEGDTLRALVGEDDDCGTELEQQSDGDADHVSAQSDTDSGVDADILSSASVSDDIRHICQICNKSIFMEHINFYCQNCRNLSD